MELEKVVVGDWSFDGHGMSDSYIIKVPCKFDTNEAYKVGTEAVGFDLKRQCADYENSNFSKAVYTAIEETAAKYDVPMWDMEFFDDEDDDMPTSFATSDDFFQLWLVVVNIGKQIMSLGSPPIEEEKISCKRTHNIGGYGLFSS